MLLNGGQWNGTRILKPATVREMTSNQIGDLTFMSPTDRFGYGFGIAGAGKDQVAAVGSYYWGGFYHTGFWVDPEKKLVGVIMTQVFPSEQPGLYGDFMKLASAAPQPVN